MGSDDTTDQFQCSINNKFDSVAYSQSGGNVFFALSRVFAFVMVFAFNYYSKKLLLQRDDRNVNMVKGLILPFYFHYIYIYLGLAILCFVTTIFVQYIMKNEYNAFDYVYPLETAGFHAIYEGLAFFLIPEGAGLRAMYRAIGKGCIWGGVTFFMFFLIFAPYRLGIHPHHPDSMTYTVYTVYNGTLLLFYGSFLVVPKRFLSCRPAMVFYARWNCFFGLLSIFFASLLYSPLKNNDLFCGVAATAFIFSAFIQPMVVYFTLRIDSQYWQGISPVNDGSNPMAEVWASVDPRTADSMATGLDTFQRSRSTANVPVLHFGLLQFDNDRKFVAGGFSRVYFGRYRHERVALKAVFRMELTPEDINEFYREAQILKSLHHRNVVQLKGICNMPPMLTLVLEYCYYGSLFDFLYKARDTTQPTTRQGNIRYRNSMKLKNIQRSSRGSSSSRNSSNSSRSSSSNSFSSSVSSNANANASVSARASSTFSISTEVPVTMNPIMTNSNQSAKLISLNDMEAQVPSNNKSSGGSSSSSSGGSSSSGRGGSNSSSSSSSGAGGSSSGSSNSSSNSNNHSSSSSSSSNNDKHSEDGSSNSLPSLRQSLLDAEVNALKNSKNSSDSRVPGFTVSKMKSHDSNGTNESHLDLEDSHRLSFRFSVGTDESSSGISEASTTTGKIKGKKKRGQKLQDLLDWSIGIGQSLGVGLSHEGNEQERDAAAPVAHGLTFEQRVGMMKDCANAIAFLHAKGYCHCDIKSLNFLVADDFTVKLADMGEVRSMATKRGTYPEPPRPAINWRPPEVVLTTATGDAYTAPSDVYGLAIVIAELVLLELPFGDDPNLVTTTEWHRILTVQGRRPELMNPPFCEGPQYTTRQTINTINGLPSKLVTVIEQAWHTNPNMRPTASVLANEIDHVLQSLMPDRYTEDGGG